MELTYEVSDERRRRLLEEIGAARAREMLETMCTIRAFEEKAKELYALGRIHGTMHLSIGQEGTAVGALDLVVNMIVLWNTLYMNKAINYLKAGGLEVRDEDVARLTPLGFDHIHFLGRYDFTLRATPEVGGLRPLRRIRSS